MRLIDADALMDDAMERYCKDCDKRKGIKSGKWRIVYEIGDAPCRACSVDDMKDELENAPTIDAVPVRHGKWILVHEADETGNALYECSVCHKGEVHVPIVEVNYCWNCGADMRGGDDEV